jgi:hypothetical protein
VCLAQLIKDITLILELVNFAMVRDKHLHRLVQDIKALVRKLVADRDANFGVLAEVAEEDGKVSEANI